MTKLTPGLENYRILREHKDKFEAETKRLQKLAEAEERTRLELFKYEAAKYISEITVDGQPLVKVRLK